MDNLVKIFDCPNQPEVRVRVTEILEKSSKNHREQAIISLRKRSLKDCSFGLAHKTPRLAT